MLLKKEQVNKYLLYIEWSKLIVKPVDLSNTSTRAIIVSYKEHPSVKAIKEMYSEQGTDKWDFIKVYNSQIFAKIKSLKSNKACGYDGIPAKLIKCAQMY